MPWVPASVPGHVHLDLVRAGIIADPFERLNELGCQWVDEEDWEFQTSFPGEAAGQDERQVLRFEGLDSVGEVWLNGEKEAEFSSMFVPLEIDVTGRLKDENHLRVLFRSPRAVGRAAQAAYFEAEGLPEDTRPFDHRNFVRKAQYMYGWDWGPCLASCGIWLPVKLVTFSSRIHWVWPRQQHREDGSVMLHLEGSIEGEGRLRYRLTAPDGAVMEAEDPEAQILVSQPELWWPNGYGSQPLYTLEAELVRDGEAVDSRTMKIGLRQIELKEFPDEKGASFEFWANGKPIWTAGSNWIPDHSFPSIITRERIFSQVRLAKEMGTLMLRIWGGGIFETDDFYDACDEMGILVWQDFPYACGYAPDSESYRAAAVLEAEVQAPRLRWRTSLAIWCGNNENQTMHESRWGGDKMPERFHGEVIWEEHLPKAMAALDPDRPYIPSSPTGTKGKGNGDDCRDVHYWNVWHGRGDWEHYLDSFARFCSEFGFASSPSRECWNMCLRPEDEAPRSPAVRWHDKTRKGYETYLGYVHLHYPEIETLDDLIYYSQLNQRDAMRFALQHYRTNGATKGALIWQFNDCWPVQSWALVDYAQKVKPAGEEMKRCFAPVLAAIKLLDDKVQLWIVNDSHETVEGGVMATVFTTDTGQACGAWSFPGQKLAMGERRMVAEWPRTALGGPSLVMKAEFGPAGGPAILLLQKPKDTLTGESRVKAKAVQGGVEFTAAGAPAIDLFVDLEGKGRRVITVLPGDKVVLDGALATRDARSLHGPVVLAR